MSDFIKSSAQKNRSIWVIVEGDRMNLVAHHKEIRTREEMIEIADRALYQAKEGGRNRVEMGG